jgi:hypothetical protein
MTESPRFRENEAKIATPVLYAAWLIAAVMLVFALAEKQPGSFYTLLHWVCCAVFVYSAVTSFQMKRMLWLWIFRLLAIVFNPVFVLPLDRSSWIVAGWLSIGAIVIAAFVFWKVRNPDPLRVAVVLLNRD